MPLVTVELDVEQGRDLVLGPWLATAMSIDPVRVSPPPERVEAVELGSLTVALVSLFAKVSS